jgi:hypothetical protein
LILNILYKFFSDEFKRDEAETEEDKMAMLSIDIIEKQNPIHIAYKDVVIFTLVDSVDGVARVICRDLLGETTYIQTESLLWFWLFEYHT